MLRRALDDALVGAVRRKHRCSVFLLDLDRFKAVNDTLGHPAGDTLLRLVSLRLREVIGELGQVGRLGGDEFEVVLPSTSDKTELSRVAQGIIDSLSRPYTINGTVVSIGASVGIVTSDYDDRTSDDLMRDADLALYAAKAARQGLLPILRAGNARGSAASAADGIGPSRRNGEESAVGGSSPASMLRPKR